MSPNTAKSVVLLTGALMFAAIGIRRSQISDPFRFAWAAGVITIGLSLLADIAPEVAGPFAVLLLIAVYWRNRGVIGSVVPSTLNTSTAASSSAAAGIAQGSTQAFQAIPKL